MTRFNTIDGLFRPNYNIYNPVTKVEEPEIEVPYRSENVTRIKLLTDLLKETQTYPQYREELTQTPEENAFVEVGDDGKISTTLKKLREDNQQDYVNFRYELDKFIELNPKYTNIKEQLDYLAALESGYKMGVHNAQGSGALGWFQFMDGTRKTYNQQTRDQFSKDPQAQLLAAAQYYTHLQNNIKARGGDPKDFVTMYGAWWRPGSAYAYLKDDKYDFKTQYNESLSQVRKRAYDLLS